MLIVMETKASSEMVKVVCDAIESMGLKAHPMPGAQRTAIGVTGNKSQVDSDKILSQPGVKDIIHVTAPFKLVSREFYPEDSIIDVDGVKVGGEEFAMIAGPCSVESREQCMIIAEHVAKALICGADFVAIDLPLLVALECRLCGACEIDGAGQNVALTR